MKTAFQVSEIKSEIRSLLNKTLHFRVYLNEFHNGQENVKISDERVEETLKSIKDEGYALSQALGSVTEIGTELYFGAHQMHSIYEYSSKGNLNVDIALVTCKTAEAKFRKALILADGLK
jgi:hypothetical protein